MIKPESSCVETTKEPEWLSKLESRREKLTRGKLGHESGAGAPCNECGDKCPGLDLHFWRKVCRNCKCRKDQHMCVEDDSGWAQFEILGQIRSKPAYMKIKALAEQPVKLEWVPPNVAPDLVSDYMDNLGSHQIPIAGSDAAAKRKQQLEFQVPPHDLDAEFCDNLTDLETQQLQQYVKKLRENCVGQGNVVRVGDVKKPTILNIGTPSFEMFDQHQFTYIPPEVLTRVNAHPSQILKDGIITKILSSEQFRNALLCEPAKNLPPRQLVISLHPATPDFEDCSNLREASKEKLKNLNMNQDLVKSAVENGEVYDNMINQLSKNNVDFSYDNVLGPISGFRKDYINDDDFKKDIDDFMDFLNSIIPDNSTPTKSNPLLSTDRFNSPLPVKTPVQPKFGSLMNQETPIRKVKFGSVNIMSYDLGIPADASIEKDVLLSQIINSEILQSALQTPATKLLPPSSNKVVVSTVPMVPDFEKEKALSLPIRKRLEGIGMNKQAVQSGVSNGPVYDVLFDKLKRSGINYSDCSLLGPMDEFRTEYNENRPFQKEVKYFVENLPTNISICNSETLPSTGKYYKPQHISPEHMARLPQNLEPSGYLSNPQSPFKSHMHGSKSTDSGFESKPPTPNFSTFPGIASGAGGSAGNIENPNRRSNESENYNLSIGASPGKLQNIPCVEDMNMYPHVSPAISNKHPSALSAVNKDLSDLYISHDQIPHDETYPIPAIKCKECTKDIMVGEVAVKAERAGKEVGWHPQCFVCHKCRELLADLVYFFHGGNVYCGRDLALILKIPRCNACDELIFTKEYTAAEGSSFHIKHFCCYQCDTPLAGQKYIPDEKTNMPLCLSCYDEFYAERCQRCQNVIGPSEQGVSFAKLHWHGECFLCSGNGCTKSLIGGRFCVKNDMVFCSPQCVKSVNHN